MGGCLRSMGEYKPCSVKRGELVPIGEVVADLDGPVKAIREASPPPARRGFTLASIK